MTARPIRRNAQTPDRNGKIFYTSTTSLSHISKITWLVVIMLLPVFGTLLFLYTQENVGHRVLQRHYARLNEETEKFLKQDPETEKKLK